MGFIEKQKECNSKKRIVLLHSGECNSILLLHSWEIELSIRHHVTKINQLNDLNLTRYYIILHILFLIWLDHTLVVLILAYNGVILCLKNILLYL